MFLLLKVAPGYCELGLLSPPLGPAFPAAEPRSTTRPRRMSPTATDFAVFRLVRAVFVPWAGSLRGALVMGSPRVEMGPETQHVLPVPPANHAILTRPADWEILGLGRYPDRPLLYRRSQAKESVLPVHLSERVDGRRPRCPHGDINPPISPLGDGNWKTRDLPLSQ